MKTAKQITTAAPGSLEHAVLEYVGLKDRLERLEAEMATHRKVIEAAVAPGAALEIGGFKVSVSACSRENFNLKAARVVLSPDMLKPFVTVTTYNRMVIK